MPLTPKRGWCDKDDPPPRPPSYVKLGNRRNKGSNDDDGDQGGTPKGHVPVMVGHEEHKLKRYVVPTKFMKDPSIIDLLQRSADEFGYGCQGVIQLPCHVEYFDMIINRLSKKR